MRRDMQASFNLKNIIIKSIILFISLLIVINISISVNAQEKNMVLIIKDQQENVIGEILENQYFTINALDPLSQGETPYLSYVNISFNGNLYIINETTELKIRAPRVDEDEELTIIATKEGYNNTYVTILVKNNITGKLNVIPEKYVVNSGDRFTVQVLDQENNPVSMAAVGIQNKGDVTDISYTDDEGRSWLTAPKESGIIKIIAQKKGYTQDLTSIEVNIIPPWYEEIITNPFFPILSAVIVLIFIIILVNLRQKKSIFERTKEIAHKKNLQKYEEVTIDKKKPVSSSKKEYYNLDKVRVQQNNDSRVEEIRISRPKKEKDIVPVKTVEDEIDKMIQKKKGRKQKHDWFIGHDELRYEIDKLTGEINENGLHKWYDGLDDIKERINEKVKKKDKDLRDKHNGKT